MGSIKDLKNELSEMRKSMEKMTAELHETNLVIRDSLKVTSETIKEMSENFTKTFKDVLKQMSDLTIQMNIKDTILKTLGIDGMIPNFLKKKNNKKNYLFDIFASFCQFLITKYNIIRDIT